MYRSIKFVADATMAEPVRPWYGKASRDARKAQDAARKAARAAAEAKVYDGRVTIDLPDGAYIVD